MKITRVETPVRQRKRIVFLLRSFCTSAQVKKIAASCDIPYSNKTDTISLISKSDKVQMDIKFTVKPL